MGYATEPNLLGASAMGTTQQWFVPCSWLVLHSFFFAVLSHLLACIAQSGLGMPFFAVQRLLLICKSSCCAVYSSLAIVGRVHVLFAADGAGDSVLMGVGASPSCS